MLIQDQPGIYHKSITKITERSAGFKPCPNHPRNAAMLTGVGEVTRHKCPEPLCPHQELEDHALARAMTLLVSQSSIRTTDKESHDPKEKGKRQSRKLKSSTSFVHHPQAKKSQGCFSSDHERCHHLAKAFLRSRVRIRLP